MVLLAQTVHRLEITKKPPMSTLPHLLAATDFTSLPWQELAVWAVAVISFLIIMFYALGVLPRRKKMRQADIPSGQTWHPRTRTM